MSRFVVIEGLDGAGTTTQATRLAAFLRSGGGVVHTHEPTDRPIGRLIRSVLQGSSDVHRGALPWLFAADRKDHMASVVLPALERGETVVSDRYLHSSLAYQSLDLPLEQVWALNASFPAPDLTVFLDISVDDAMTRIEKRAGTREIFEKRDALAAISDQYTVVLAFLEGQGHRIERIDATLPMDIIADQIAGML